MCDRLRVMTPGKRQAMWALTAPDNRDSRWTIPGRGHAKSAGGNSIKGFPVRFSRTISSPVTDTAGAAAHLGLSPRTLEKWRTQGRGPRYSRPGRRVVYRVADLNHFLEATAVGGGR